MSNELAVQNADKWTTKKVEMTPELTATIKRLYLDEKKSSRQIAAAVGHSKKWVLNKLREFGIVRSMEEAFALSTTHASALRRSGAECHRWKGGRKKGGGGYWQVMSKGHPSSDRHGYVLEHRLVMESIIGRFLRTDEHVHHLNDTKSDNRPENLELISHSAHMSLHAKSRPRAAGGYFTKEQI